MVPSISRYLQINFAVFTYVYIWFVIISILLYSISFDLPNAIVLNIITINSEKIYHYSLFHLREILKWTFSRQCI